MRIHPLFTATGAGLRSSLSGLSAQARRYLGVLGLSASLVALSPSAVAQTTQAPTDDPCKLLTDAEVGRAVEGVKPGVRDHQFEQYGVVRCLWHYRGGVFMANLQPASAGSVMKQTRTTVRTFLDPLKPNAGSHVRYEKLSGIGDEALVVVEPPNTDQGLLAGVAAITVRRGDRQAVLMSAGLGDNDRAATLKALEELGRLAAARL